MNFAKMYAGINVIVIFIDDKDDLKLQNTQTSLTPLRRNDRPAPLPRNTVGPYSSGFQNGVCGPKGVRDGFPRGPREDSET